MIKAKKTGSRIPLTILLFGIGMALIGLLAIYDASVVDAFKSFNDKFHYIKHKVLG